VIKNPFLFVPRLAFFVVILVFMLLVMGTAWLARSLSGFTMVPGIVAALGLAVAGILLEAGQLNLLRAAVQGEPVDQETFWEGVPLYAGRVFGGVLLMLVISLLVGAVLIPLALVPGLNFLVALLAPLAMLALMTLFSLWEASMALDATGVLEAFGQSYRLAQSFFWPLLVVTFLRSLFDNNGNKGQHHNQTGFNFSLGVGPARFSAPFNMSPSAGAGLVAGMGVVAVIFAILSTLVTVYLDQLLLVIYHRRSWR
jgi:hypothetical protein